MTTTKVAYRRVYSDIDALVEIEGMTRACATSLIVMNSLLYITGKRVCAFTDKHAIVDTSCGGPESGEISGYCRRCGHSFHHQLY